MIDRIEILKKEIFLKKCVEMALSEVYQIRKGKGKKSAQIKGATDPIMDMYFKMVLDAEKEWLKGELK